MSKMREKESLECVRMHIWALKTQKLSGPLSGPWTPAADCSLRSCDSASLHRQLSASEAGAPPLDQILDPHLERDLFNLNISAKQSGNYAENWKAMNGKITILGNYFVIIDWWGELYSCKSFILERGRFHVCKKSLYVITFKCILIT